MNIGNLFSSSVGKKFVMAVTGLGLFAFVLLHMLGNLQFFLGPEAINRYGAFLQGNLELLWPARIGLLAIVSLHIWSAVKLTAENRAARPQAYVKHEVVAASYASRTMMMSGLIILAFIIYHLLHFTLQVPAVNLTGQDFAKLERVQDGKPLHDIFGMIVTGFRNPVVSLFYIFAMFLLFLHLSHGMSALFQSLGWKKPAYVRHIGCFARIVSWLIFVGYISIPISVLVFHYGSNYVPEVAK
jgi:succinate dehydrogenase / fumarate reductase cytochrome b subunit